MSGDKEKPTSRGLELDFTDVTYEAKPFPYTKTITDEDGTTTEQTATLGVRMWPDSMAEAKLQADGLVIRASENCRKFIYCLEWWKGVVDKKGKPVPCSDANKKMIFDVKADPEMIAFVLEKADEMKGRKEAQEKNS